MKKKLIIFLGIFIFMIIPKNVFALAPVLENYVVKLQGLDITSFRQNVWVPGSGTTGTLSIDINVILPDATDIHKFGYIGVCRTPVSTGNLSYYDSYLYENVQMINTGATCTNFNTNGTGQVIYFIFAMSVEKPWACSVNLTNCDIYTNNAITFTEYQGATYSLYSYGFSNERFEYNNVNGSLSTLGVGIQNVNGSISITNQKLDALGSILNNNQTATNQKLDSLNTTQTATNQKLDNINNTMSDDSTDGTFQNSSIDNMNNQLASNNVISDLLLLPVSMYQNILNSVNGTCTPFNLGSLYGTNLVMPCIQPQNYIGSTLWSTIDILFCGFFILAIRKKFVDIFNNMTNLKNGGNEIE